MKTRTIACLSALLLTAVIAAERHERPSPPPDLRDAVAASSALDQLGPDPAAAPAVPAPKAAETPGKYTPIDWKNKPELLFTGTFSKEDITGLIDATASGRDLLGHFKKGGTEFPEIVFDSQLSAAEREAARSATILNEENLIAKFIQKQDFKNNRTHIILYKPGWPLFAISCIVSHELQHALDQNAPWHRRITDIIKRAQETLDKNTLARGGRTIEDLKMDDMIYGLGYTRTFFSEYLAYSRSSTIFRELGARYPAVKNRPVDFLSKNGKSIIADDPLHNPGDRQYFVERYFWPGNRTRFKAGITAMLNNKKLIAELRTAGLDTAISELAAYNESPDPVYQAVHSLR